MKAISIKQPWANMIASGQKTIETRTWGTSYRGQILIISSKRPDITPAGYALAVAQLTGCRWMVKTDEPMACCDWYQEAFAWVLTNIRPIKPFPVKGRLGIYEVAVTEKEIIYL